MTPQELLPTLTSEIALPGCIVRSSAYIERWCYRRLSIWFCLWSCQCGILCPNWCYPYH